MSLLFPREWRSMLLKFKYHSQTGFLEAYRSYSLAQNNSLSDTVIITSDAADADKYNYCLEFICYNSKSIPKAQYISPILNYTDGGISFAIPNNLTEFRGHVDMQLTGYDSQDNSIVFKSISKNCKAFDVEGSLCVLEKDLNDTPNVFTEVLQRLEELKNIREDIINSAMNMFSDDMLKIFKSYRWFTVRYYDNGRLIKEERVIEKSKLVEPQYKLPNGCVLAEGWYFPSENRIWDFDRDTAEQDIDLYLNYMSEGVAVRDGMVTSFGSRTRSHIYIPEYYDGYKVDTVKSNSINVPYESYIHLGNNMENFEILLTNANVLGLYFPLTHPLVKSDGGYMYVQNDGEYFLFFAPKLKHGDTLAICDGCKSINTMAINGIRGLKHLILPDSLQHLAELSIVDTDVEELILPKNISIIDGTAICNNRNLKKIVIEGDISDIITENTFISVDGSNNVIRPTLYVFPEYYENYKAKNLAYELKVVGGEYFDARYALNSDVVK